MTARNWVDHLVSSDGKDRSHILSLPYWTLFVRTAQTVFALVLLILTAFSASKLRVNAAGYGLTWFTFALVVIYFVYLGYTLAVHPSYYHPLAHFSLEILVNIFWLCSWAVLASEAASLDDFASFYHDRIPSRYKSAIDALKASAVLGAVEWVLFTVTLVYLAIAFINSTRPPCADGGELNIYGGGPAKPAAATDVGDPPPAQAYEQPPDSSTGPSQHPPV